MKTLLFVLFLSFFGCNETKTTSPVTGSETDAVAPVEDCATNSEEAVEITEDTISFENPDAGCTIKE